jgi:hypothetical protein
MDDHHRHIFGTASWPTQYGNPFNSNVAPVSATAQGQVLWSAPLPTRDGGGIVVAADGRCIVESRRYLTAIRPGAQVDWTIEMEPTWWGYTPILLADGRFVRAEPDFIAVRDQATGALLASLPVSYARGLTLTPDGALVFTKSQKGGNRRLHKITLEGEVHWSQPLASWSFGPPLVLEHMIIVGDGSYLRAYDFDGMLLWIANQDGFQHADPTNREQLATALQSERDQVEAPVIWLGNNLLLAQLQWYTDWAFYLFDLGTYTVRPLDAPFAVRRPRPLTPLTLPNHEPRLVTKGPSKKVAYNWQGTVVALDLNGRVVWQHEIKRDIQPGRLIADAAGKIFFGCSPSFERWEKYHGGYGLSDVCFVRCLSPEGQELWTWFAPGPLSHTSAIGAAGELYEAAEGRLWAIG